LSYKQALLNAKISLPRINNRNANLNIQKINSNSNLIESKDASYSEIDLTGEFSLEDFHNKDPLFKTGTSTTCSNEIKNVRLITINIKIKSQIRKYKHPEDQRFHELFKRIAADENVPYLNIFLYNGNKRIIPDNTLQTINHKISSIYSKEMRIKKFFSKNLSFLIFFKLSLSSS
jgi:hypothetical protein